MNRPRYPKPDNNQAKIIAQLENLGFVVRDVSSLPISKSGCDIYVYGWNAKTKQVELHGFEIKMPGEDLNDNEREFFAQVMFLGGNCRVLSVARSVDDVLKEFGRL